MATNIGTGGGRQNRVMLWAPPRSLSTAFERCISTQILDHNIQIFHEPYTTCYHIGPERQIKFPAFFARYVVSDNQYTYKWVKETLEAEHPKKEHIFVKDLGYSVDTKFDYLPAGFQHTFLIRNPAKIFSSFEALLNKFPLSLCRLKLSEGIISKGMVFKEMSELFNHVTEDLGQKAVIIDADDLVENPLEVLKLYCSETGLPFSPNMTSNWRKGSEDLKMWKYSKKLIRANALVGQYDRAFSSPGLGKPSKRDVDELGLSDYCREAIRFSEPFYRKLYDLRIKVPAENNGAE